jgi:uncharacterized protein (TIGR02145 family)
MKNVNTIFCAIILGPLIFTSCGENSKKEKAVSTMNEKESIVDVDTNKISEPSVSVPTIKIGQQEWMTDDINSSVYNNGDPINEAKSEKQWKDYGNKKTGCYRKLSNGTYVYNSFAVNDNRGIIPTGFILPTYAQFNQLLKLLGGGDSKSGIATKSMATYPIYIEDWVGDQETGGFEAVEIKANGNSKFNARKGGFVYDFGTASEGNCSYWWTSSSEDGNLIVVDIGYCSQDLGGGKGSYAKTYGFAVRGLKK